MDRVLLVYFLVLVQHEEGSSYLYEETDSPMFLQTTQLQTLPLHTKKPGST
jgi:hypothetical protein